MKNSSRSLSLGQKLLFIPGLALIGLVALQFTNSYVTHAVSRQVIFPNLENLMLEGHKNALRTVVESEAQSLGNRIKDLKTREEKIAAVVAETDPIRFFDDKSGYFFAYDLSGIRINVPINKSGNGKNMIDLRDKNGFPFIQALIEKVRAGGGFVTYYFEKEGKGVQPKLGYATLLPGTDFFIGTGVYIDNVEAERISLAERIKGEERRYVLYVSAMFAVIFGATLVVTLWLSRAFTATVKQIIERLRGNSQQVAAASAQLSSQSNILAEGASRQAATIEEAFASLEEMSSMTQRNTESAEKADELAKLAQTSADRGSADMHSMATAIASMNAASNDIAKIIKNIDEIAFQTNILALNAAVEAARAGDAGTGFAVVADEVRNLAQRSARAARETNDKIAGALSATANGVHLSEKVAATLNDIVSNVGEVVALATEVAQASSKQTQNIRQINTAVGLMSEVTQATAANAEESAAAASELSAQTESMNDAVTELLHLVGGRNGAN